MVLFWEKGFHQTSVQELVQEIGINRASLYDTYHDKEGLFKESFNFYRHSVKENIQSIFNQHKTIKAGYNDFIKYLIKLDPINPAPPVTTIIFFFIFLVTKKTLF